MRISGAQSSAGLNNLYNTLFQGKISMHVSRLSRDFLPVNNAQNSKSLSMDSLQYISDIKSASSSLSAALKDLSGPAFNQRSMVSSNPDAMTVNVTGNNTGSTREISVQIDQIAMGQLNEGSRMNSADSYTGDRGVNRFEITAGGKTTQLSINVAAGDSNRDVQQKMADAINNAGIGLKATVDTDSATKVSMLRVESNNVGTDERNAFSIRDFTGNAVARTGINEVSRERQDAIYRVNGGEAQISRSNTVNLGNGVSATFKASTEQAVTVSRGKDISHIRGVIENMVRSYNSLFSAAAGNVNDFKAQSLASRLMNVTIAYSRSLSDIGISFDNDGKMTVDSNKLNQAFENGRAERFFTENSGRNFGFTPTLSRLSDSVSGNPASFVSNPIGQNFAYSGFGNPIPQSFFGSGSILDYMF